MRNLSISFIAISALIAACGGGDPEAQVLGSFFSAVQKGDQVGVQRVSLATFDGNAESWEIIERGAEAEGPFELFDLEAQLEKIRNDVRDQRQSNARFVSDNNDTYQSYVEKYNADPSAPFQGALATFHEQLQEKQARLAQLEADSSQLALDIQSLKNAATLSLSTPVDTTFEGQIIVKPLQVRVNDGSGEKAYTVVLQRYELVDTRQNRTPRARWIIAEIQPQS